MWHRTWGLLMGFLVIISLFSKGVFIGNCYGSDLGRESSRSWDVSGWSKIN